MKRIRSTSESFLFLLRRRFDHISLSLSFLNLIIFFSISLFPVFILVFIPVLFNKKKKSHTQTHIPGILLRHLFRSFFFLLSTSRTFPKRNELIQTWRFCGVSFTVLQVSHLYRLRFVDVLQLLLVQAVW